ncbi:translation initiation factor eIF-2B subunit alpha isoform X2 [Leguminivora glycinivorella]|uniref:translation initiation factor eIF-2B subunit alpha isoform X2 n=1 Tax=Leguminivora glycinivorella TaxID=1035111 RepID=UPI00200E0B04|nr:translation initiation factor eIF-2B subunit alpha isoform X2 [Leguminivora glycinivorella]
MKKEEVQEIFLKILREEEDVSAGVAAIRTLLTVIKTYKVATVRELDLNLQLAVDAMRHCDQPVTAISSGCELFMRFITFAKLDMESFDKCQEIMLERGNVFLQTLLEARGKVAAQALPFISDGCKILTHSRSRVVLQAMLEAAQANKRFQVYVTMSGPENSGALMHKQLTAAGVDSTLILDAAVGYILEQVDIVMLGAEGVTESGGIINKIGTYGLAMAALELKKPVYVLTESFKFSRIYPLNQQDLPKEFKYLSSVLKNGAELRAQHPLVDYTPPAYITLLFTDLGILTPSAVSDELIKLYL